MNLLDQFEIRMRQQIYLYWAMNRQSWTVEEDEAISRLVCEFGIDDWTKIAAKLKEHYSILKRTGKQCRERWYNHLNPSVNKHPWTAEEEVQLFSLHKEFGNRWKDISKYFYGRTDNDIKNHFYSTLRRSLRRLNKILGEKNSTSQMREIKPSVLSTIMNFIYSQQNQVDTELISSLTDLPLLIFEFANFKPIKNNIRANQIEDVRDKIANIFELISKFNLQYEKSKSTKHQIKMEKKQSNSSLIKIESYGIQCNERVQEQKGINEQIEAQSQDKATPQTFNSNQQTENPPSLTHCSNPSTFDLDFGRPRGISLDKDEMDYEFFMDMEQPSQQVSEINSLELIVVGRHWQPKEWEACRNETGDGIDQVLEFHYDIE